MTMKSPQMKYTIPVFVLFSLAGFYFIALQMYLSHAPDRFLAVHKASQVPLAVTHIPFLDKILTPLVSFFVAAFGDTTSYAYPTTVDFVWSFSAAIQIPLIESQRVGASGWIAYPMIWGMLYQRLSGGWILPIWLLAFMHSRTREEGAGISQERAEAVMFGWWVGHTIPALAMLVPGLPALTHAPIWIAFPILMSVAVQIYFPLRRKFSQKSQGAARWSPQISSGFTTLQLTYLSAFVASCIAHVCLVVIPALSNPSPATLYQKMPSFVRQMYMFFIPATGIRVPSVAATTAASGVEHFVQWDVIVVFSAVWTAGIWDLVLRRRSDTHSIKSTSTTPSKSSNSSHAIFFDIIFIGSATLILVLMSIALGPGAATSALWAYREMMLEKRRIRILLRRDSGESCESVSNNLVKTSHVQVSR